MIVLYIFAAALGYFLGSVPFGLVLTKLAGTQDIRTIGSGNIGATNVLRTGRKGLAAATLLADVLKGSVAVLAMTWWCGPDCGLIAGAGAFLGHLFPLWLGFKGGKGVATFIGVLIGLKPLVSLIFVVIWLGLAFATRYSSLSGLAATAATPVVLWGFGEGPMAAVFVLMTILLWWKHRENIRRLAAGTEARIGQKG